MSLADTARLVASLELQDKFSGTAGSATRALGNIDTATARASRGMGVFGHAASTALGIGLERVVSGGVRLLTNAITGGVGQLNELESVTTATSTVIGSTGGVAGQTATEIRALAEEYEGLNASMGDDVIQAGSNMLLTFTNVREKAFEPALAAALDMNEAMGGGPEGLQNTIIQVGKALNDPIQGVGALRRVGVQLTDQQEAQVKTLIEANDLYGAQTVILDELATQFGGRFAAAGRTAEGRQAALVDRTEDLQKALAGPLMPAIDRARENLITLFESPAAIAASTKLGDTIAGLFTEENLDRGVGVLEDGLARISAFDFDQVGDGVQKVFGFLGEVPWDTIGSGLEITGRATKGVVDAFLSLPKEVQGVAIAALAANKLSGGLVASGIGSLASLALRSLTHINAGHVTVVGAGVGGPGGVPVGPGRDQSGTSGWAWVGRTIAAATGAAIGYEIASPEFQRQLGVGRDFMASERDQLLSTGSPAQLRSALEGLDATIAELRDGIAPEELAYTFDLGGVKTEIQSTREAIVARLEALEHGRAVEGPPRPAGLSGFGVSELQAMVDKIKAATSLPDTRMGMLPDTRMALPDTAMAPVKAAVLSQTAELVRTRTEITGKLMAGVSKQEQVAAAIRGQYGLLGQIRDRAPVVNVSVHPRLSIDGAEIAYRLQSITQSVTGGTDPAGSRAR